MIYIPTSNDKSLFRHIRIFRYPSCHPSTFMMPSVFRNDFHTIFAFREFLINFIPGCITRGISVRLHELRQRPCCFQSWYSSSHQSHKQIPELMLRFSRILVSCLFYLFFRKVFRRCLRITFSRIRNYRKFRI